MIKTMTMEQALSEGYIYATLEGGEGELVGLKDLSNEDIKTTDYLLIEKKGRPFSIDKNCIKDLLEEHIASNDEVYDESSALDDIVQQTDYSEITKTLNDQFSKHIYYYAEEIRLLAV